MKINYIAAGARVGRNVQIGHFTVINEGVEIGDNVVIGNNVTVYEGVKIGANVKIGDNCVLGKSPDLAITSTVKSTASLPPLTIGERTIIGASVVLYKGSKIGKDSLVADLASIREKCAIGDCVIIGRGVAVENHVTIGSYTKVQTGAYITAYTEIDEYVFIAPLVTTTNDNYMGRTRERLAQKKGPVIKKGARVGGGSILLPGTVVAEETFVAAGALVTGDTVRGKVYMGLPAREIRRVPDRELLENQNQEELT